MKIEKYKKYIENSINEIDFIGYYEKKPKSRYETIKYCFDQIFKRNFKNIVELGTSRSYVNGRHIGCNKDDKCFWNKNKPQNWDWGAGVFTRLCAETIDGFDINLTTVDLNASHIERSRHMTEEFNNINYVVDSSLSFLAKIKNKIDLLYIDTGDMTPIEYTANIQLKEAKIIIENNLVSDNGIILIDDVKHPAAKKQNGEDLGKACYSIPYFLENGYKIIMDEFQFVLEKK